MTLVQFWQSPLLKLALSGRRRSFSFDEKVAIEKEMLDWEYRLRVRSIERMTLITSDARNSIRFWVEVNRQKEIHEIESGAFRCFQ